MLTVISGGMFSEKSTELQRRGRRLERAGKNIMYFKPDIDDRYSVSELVTHDGLRVPSLNIPSHDPDYLLGSNFLGVDAVLIDEVQFLHPTLHSIIEEVLVRYPDLQFIVAGLDMDFRGKHFLTTAILMANAEKVIKLNAVCSSCGTDAWVSYKEPNDKRIELGTDEYTPLCRKCFNKK